MAGYVSQPGSTAIMPVEKLTYLGIADDLAARIASGEYPTDSRLPSVTELCAIYSASRSTVVRAMGMLRDRGLTYGIQGVGVFVSRQTTG